MAGDLRSRWLLLGILLVAAALRFYRLDGQSLWYDEGTSAALATRDPITIARNAADDIHPPLYYEMLRIWTVGFGHSEIALRGFSALTGVAVVWVTYLLGKELGGWRVGVFAGAVSAFSPLGIHYSQEVRMYMLATLWGGLAVYSTLRFVNETREARGRPPKRSRRPRMWILGYVFFAAGALYTHYFGFTIVLVANGVVGLWLLRGPDLRSRKVLGPWVAGQAAIVVLYLPWLLFAGGALIRWPATSPPVSPVDLGMEVLRGFSLGPSWDGSGGWLLFGFLAVAILGLLPRRASEPPMGRAADGVAAGTALMYLVVPPLAMYLLSLHRPFFSIKLLLLATPGFHLLLGRGIEAGWMASIGRGWEVGEGILRVGGRLFAAGALLFLAAASPGPLWNYYFDPRYARDDYRGLARYLEAAAGPEDVILLNAPTQVEIFSYYFGGEAEVTPFPLQRPPDPVQTAEALEHMVADREEIHAVLWATDESDPEGVVERWLDTNAYPARDAWYGSVRLASYAGPEAVVGFVPLDAVQFGEAIGLAGFATSAEPARPGEIHPFSFSWEALAPVGERLIVSLQALDRNGHIVGQRDSEPRGGSRPTSEWRVGEEVTDHVGLSIHAGTPPGSYDLILAVYGPDGRRLNVTQNGAAVGDHLGLGMLEVGRPETPPSLELLGMLFRREVDFGPLRLRGYNLTRLGDRSATEVAVIPGEALEVTLFWEVISPPPFSPDLELRVSGPNGESVVSQEREITEGMYPAGLWREGEILRDPHHLVLPSDAVPSRYRVQVRVQDGGGNLLGPGRLDLGPVTVVD